MGKGDRRSKRGKIWRGTSGVTRLKKKASKQTKRGTKR
ncbi:MAG: 30S ribosomal protein THX [Candidatus Eisenbacteria bacterium]|jgi:ribosomal small subunit protein bTHX